jgi:hypothetical protein
MLTFLLGDAMAPNSGSGRRARSLAVAVLLFAAFVLLVACRQGATDDPRDATDEDRGGAYFVAYTKLPVPPLGADRTNYLELWVHDLRNGVETRLISAEDGFTRIGQPQWAPGGDAITFAGDGGIAAAPAPALYRVTLDGTLTAIEIEGREPFFFHEWAPDGESLAILTTKTGEARGVAVTIVGAGGEPQVLRTESLFFDWSSDGTLYYQELRIEDDGARGNLYAVRGRLEEPVVIAGIDDYDHRFRGVTSDGDVLVFDVRIAGCRWVRAVSASGESLWVTPGQGAGVSPVGDLVVVVDWQPPVSQCDDPFLEVAGRLVVSQSGPATTAVLKADGSLVTRFRYPEDGYSSLGAEARSLGSSGAPAWDPAGERLLLPARGENDTEVVWLADVEGGDLVEIHRVAAGDAIPGDGWIALALGPGDARAD